MGTKIDTTRRQATIPVQQPGAGQVRSMATEMVLLVLLTILPHVRLLPETSGAHSGGTFAMQA